MISLLIDDWSLAWGSGKGPNGEPPLTGLFLVVLVQTLVAIYAGFSINVNRFSLHGTYRNRLVRAYLGASSINRSPDLFTGLDSNDSPPMHELRAEAFHDGSFSLDKKQFGEFVSRFSDSKKPHYARLRERFSPATRDALQAFENRRSAFGDPDEERTTAGESPHDGSAAADESLERVGSTLVERAMRRALAGEFNTLLDMNPQELARILNDEIVPEGQTFDSDPPTHAIHVHRNRDLLEKAFRGFLVHYRPCRLFPVINVALNLVRGPNLAWQDRKAESFTITPMHCGNMGIGYRRSHLYGGGLRHLGRAMRPRRAISLGTAMTISGAAASPNMGYHSSPFITFLMALFNVRLGWWLGNPGPAGDKTFGRSYPVFALHRLLAEAFGMTTDRSAYVYLSDGGHFDNLGVYEMVLRRCRRIVVVDATADPKYAFDDLGNTIRKIRSDFGIPITFDQPITAGQKETKNPDHEDFQSTPSRGSASNAASSGKYWATATIHYSIVDGPAAPCGTLIYLKPAVFGKSEPMDIFSYRKTSGAFPQEATADQFFSEAQFESYRALGYHTVRAACRAIEKVPGEKDRTLSTFLRAVRIYRGDLAPAVGGEPAKAKKSSDDNPTVDTPPASISPASEASLSLADGPEKHTPPARTDMPLPPSGSLAAGRSPKNMTVMKIATERLMEEERTAQKPQGVTDPNSAGSDLD